MGTIVKLKQGSAEWLAHRKTMRNASETAVVMGASPWMTPYQLWLVRTGRSEQHVNEAMRRGAELEPQARAAYEELTGLILQPLVLVDGEYSASLDGMTFDGSLIVEIKCPFKGRQSSLWQAAMQREIPPHYRWQIEHQLMVSGAQQAHLYVFDAESREGLIVESAPNPACWPAMHAAWDTFMRCIETDTPPALTDRDKRVRTDGTWQAAAEAYVTAKAAADVAADALKSAKERLLALATHPSESGGGVSVTRFWKQGAVDYKLVPALGGLDLEPYRKAGKEEVRITVAD
jgi:putative phage-type endonuclease